MTPTLGQLDAVEAIMRAQQQDLDAAHAELAILRARLGIEADDGIASLYHMRALEDAADIAREHLAGRASAQDLRAAVDRVRAVT